MRVIITNTHAVEKPGFFGRARLTYTLALGVQLTEFELVAIDQKNLYARVIFEPPPNPMWGLREDEDVPCFLVHHLVELHDSGTIAAVGYFSNDHDAHLGESKLRKSLEQLKEILTTTRSERDEYEL